MIFECAPTLSSTPPRRRFRSWFFDSRGGFGGGAWTRRENQYEAAIVSVLPDGQIGSSVMTWEQLDADTVAWQAVERSGWRDAARCDADLRTGEMTMEAKMRFSTLVFTAAQCCLPVIALAVPPRELSRNSATLRQPRDYRGTPSLSTAASSSQRRQASPAAGFTPGGATAAATYWRSAASVLPSTPSYRPSPAISATRPSAGTRPAQNSPQDLNAWRWGRTSPAYNRPDVVINRPDINFGRPTIDRRFPNVNATSSTTTINHTTINNLNKTTINNTSVINQNIVNRPVVDRYRPPVAYYPQLHYHWRPTTWSGIYRPAYYNYNFNVSTAGGGWMSIGSTNFAYVNPFYVRPATTTAIRFDYSQPIRVPSAAYQETANDLIRSEQAIRRFDDARKVFRRGEYGRANDLIDEAIERLPNDPTLHQFRGLVLFARQRYQDAASVIYSVLAVSPGWDGATLVKLYDTPQRYLAQVSQLEQFTLDHPEAIEAQFLLAYHDVIKGDLVGTERMLERVRAARPNDPVVQNFLAAVRR